MMKPVYILSACAISPQHSFDPSQFLKPVVSSGEGKLFVADPDYRQYINPVAIRRMSRLMKMDWLFKRILLPSAYMDQIKALDVKE